MLLPRRTALARLAAAPIAMASGCAQLAPLPDTLPEVLTGSLGDNLDGLVLYLERPGHTPLRHAAGWKDRVTRSPAKPDSLFKIASISKLYIAAAAAKLAARGQLALKRTLASYLPGQVHGIANADRITVEMLLRHRSGLFNFTDARGFPWFAPPRGLDEHLQWVRGQPAVFAPGTGYAYSNTNYLLVGAILDHALGYDHQDYIQQALLRPLGLSNTFGQLAQAEPARLVSVYHPAYSGDFKQLAYTAPGGSMVATAQDVGVFLRALRSGTLLSADERALYATLYVFDHTGLLPGYLSIARHHADLDAVVVLFANSSAANAWGQIEAAETRVLRWARRQASVGLRAARAPHPPGAGTAPSPRRMA